ncbi:XRE family transcriptional regulator [Streptomyces sp. FIT100]|uniref:helix-turn-helix domain-containing protein n=1 Tax=Streptomyces sp. FIT100 TaxID=2837956 RepID=UPI0021C787F9|nr:DUF2690 domain-containing protein [Streptomyces sp. FIT100]UUN26594.1 DUF2690 domain-containing protein [Streptomyces sp. FIT100]
MSRRRPLPGDLPLEVRHLVEALGEAKDRSGLSLAVLEKKTAFSRSSWARYLSGQKLPPLSAVRALAAAVGADDARLSALWELADRSWRLHGSTVDAGGSADRQHAVAGEPSPRPEADGPDVPGASTTRPVPAAGPSEGAPRRWHTRRVTTLAVAGASALLVLVAAVVAFGDEPAGEDPRSSAVAPHGSALPTASPTAVTTAHTSMQCRHDACGGQDPKAMGCGQDAWTAAATWISGALVELRYSPRCAAVWGRILWVGVGDTVIVRGPNNSAQSGRVKFGEDAYSSMIPVSDPSQARACVELADGREGGCTGLGQSMAVSAPPEPSPARSR